MRPSVFGFDKVYHVRRKVQNLFYHFPLLNHLRHKVLLSFPFFLLIDLEIFVEKCIASATANPNELTPLLLH